MLTAAAEESTVLCVVEDAHWLDSATADALLFCARRLGADRVLLVFSARDDGDRHRSVRTASRSWRCAGSTRLQPGRCSTSARDVAQPEVTERLIAETGGNPLALCSSCRPSSAPTSSAGRRRCRPSCT